MYNGSCPNLVMWSLGLQKIEEAGPISIKQQRQKIRAQIGTLNPNPFLKQVPIFPGL